MRAKRANLTIQKGMAVSQTKGLGLDLGFHQRDRDFGNGMWGNVPDHSAVDTTKAAAYSQKIFSEMGLMDVPLAPAIPDDLVRKACGLGAYAHRYDEGEPADKLEDQLMKAKINTIVTLARGSEIAMEAFGIRKADRENLDYLLDLDIQKATDTTSNLMHVIADQNVAYLYKRAYPIQALIPTEANKGKTANWDAIAPFDLGSWGPITEDAELVDSSQAPYNRSQVVKYFATVFRVTKAAQFAGLAQIPPRDMLAIRIDAAQDAMRAGRERAMLGVNLSINDTNFAFRPTLSLTTDSTNLYFNGIYQMLQNNTSGATSNQTWVASSGNSYNQINTDLGTTYRYMRKFGMMPNLAITDLRTFTVYKQGLQDFFRSAPVTTFHQGISKVYLSFPGGPDGLPLIATEFLPQTAGQGAIFLIDTAMMSRRSLWQDMFEDLAKINLSQKGVISCAETFIDKSDVNGTSTLQGGVIGIA
jgi:hypothetical protein